MMIYWEGKTICIYSTKSMSINLKMSWSAILVRPKTGWYVICSNICGKKSITVQVRKLDKGVIGICRLGLRVVSHRTRMLLFSHLPLPCASHLAQCLMENVTCYLWSLPDGCLIVMRRPAPLARLNSGSISGIFRVMFCYLPLREVCHTQLI